MLGWSAASHALQRPFRASRRRLVFAALVGNVLASVACGEDVLVARFGLTSNAPDGGIFEVAAEDAGTGKNKIINEQSTAAQKARLKARRSERANDHLPPPPPRPSDSADSH